jgi:hypothetical protein
LELELDGGKKKIVKGEVEEEEIRDGRPENTGMLKQDYSACTDAVQ